MFSSSRKPSAFDAFAHLVAYFALVSSAIAVGGIIFQIINRYVPTLEPGVYYGGYGEPVNTSALRFHIASLLLNGPLLIAMTAYLHRLFRADALDIASGVRRWLTYLLLFAAAVNIVGSIIALVYQFLGGNYTTNFLLKAATVLVVAAAIFGFYFWELKRPDYRARQSATPLILAAAAVLFIGLEIGGFLLIGSPRQARMREYDRQRVDRALQLHGTIADVFRRDGVLPDDLTALEPTLGEDPETGAPFGYERLADDRYRLCVTFALEAPTPVLPPGVPAARVPKPYGGTSGEQVWYQHGSGEECHTFALKRRSPDDQYIETEVDAPATGSSPTATPSPRPER